MTKRALLLINRHARRGQDSLTQVTQQLQTLGFELIEASTEHPRVLPETIRRYREQVELVIVGGGDGTLNAAVQGMVGTNLPLGILPLGTANDLGRTLGIPVDLSEACRVIATGKAQSIDLGLVNGRYFFNVASLGLSVQITQKLTKEMKRRWGVLAYAVTAIQALSRSRPFSAEIWVGDTRTKVRTVQIAIGNGRYYGGGMTVAMDATIDDQRLDLYSLEIQHWWQMLSLLPTMRQGTHIKSPHVRAMQGQEIRISTRRPHPINTDGEITTQTPAHFRVVPHALLVLVPQKNDSDGLKTPA
jgi:diacylglycerol kinase (ATP)